MPLLPQPKCGSTLHGCTPACNSCTSRLVQLISSSHRGLDNPSKASLQIAFASRHPPDSQVRPRHTPIHTFTSPTGTAVPLAGKPTLSNLCFALDRLHPSLSSRRWHVEVQSGLCAAAKSPPLTPANLRQKRRKARWAEAMKRRFTKDLAPWQTPEQAPKTHPSETLDVTGGVARGVLSCR